MARMIPPAFPIFNERYAKRNAELAVYKMFENAKSDGADKWKVFYSLDVSHSFEKEIHKKKIKSEIDFLVLAPDLGVVALEVKGGEIRTDENGAWYSTDRNGIDNPIENPFKQIEDNIFILKNKFEKEKCFFPFFAYGVMFPDCNYQLESEISYDQWCIFDKRDNRDVVSFIIKLSGKWRQRYLDKGYKYIKPPKEEMDILAAYLIPHKREILYSDWVKQIEISQEKFSEEQLQALYDSTVGHKRCLVEGYTGTGKTIIAIETAKDSLKKGERVAFFCYNSILGKYLQTQLPPINEHFFVGNFHKFLLERIKKANLQLEIPGSKKDYFEESRKIPEEARIKFPEEVADNDDFWEKTVPEKAREALAMFPVEYDKVIIDEAQDLFVYSYFDIIDKILKGGMDKGRWCLFADPEQDITKKKYRMPYNEALVFLGRPEEDYLRRPTLSANWRNSKKIAETVSKLVKFSNTQNTTARIEDGPGIQYVHWSTVEEQKENIEKWLDRLKTDKIKSNQITLLTIYDPHLSVNPSWYEKSVISKISGKYKLTEYKHGQNGITYSSISSFKGMENSVIILVDVESYSNTNLLYVGMSRARSILLVFESKEAKKEREQLMSGKEGGK